MKHLLLILLLSLNFSQELKVEGNLNVTGAVINDSLVQVIDSLKVKLETQNQQITSLEALVSQLQVQIIFLGQQLGLADCLGDFGGDATEDICGVCDNNPDNDGNYDNCGVCDNDVLNDCDTDCTGVWGGDATEDCAGVCDGTTQPEDCYVTDIDGNVYQNVQIGEQLWMAENLKVVHYRNGDAIPTDIDDWSNTVEGAYSIYGNESTNAEVYGNLYNWFAVDDDRGICPEGFHVPTDDEFKTLEIYLGISQSEINDMLWRGYNEGSQLAGNAYLWDDGSLEQSNEFGISGFNGLPSGYREGHNYVNISGYGCFWSSTEYVDSQYAWRRVLKYDRAGVYRHYNYFKKIGFSVRCLKD